MQACKIGVGDACRTGPATELSPMRSELPISTLTDAIMDSDDEASSPRVGSATPVMQCILEWMSLRANVCRQSSLGSSMLGTLLCTYLIKS